jgi:hypothetical protein
VYPLFIAAVLLIYVVAIKVSKDWDPPLPRPMKDTYDFRERILAEMDRLF